MKKNSVLCKRIISGTLGAIIVFNMTTLFPMSTLANDVTFSETNNTSTFFNENKYQVFDNSMSWNEAEAYCESLGGHLATITSEEEQKFINENLFPVGTKNTYFIGLSRSTSDNAWEWITGETFEYENWDTGEPNNTSENYVHIYRNINNLGMWNNTFNYVEEDSNYSTNNTGFICEWENEDTIKVNHNIKNYTLFSATQANDLNFYGWKSDISGNVYSGASFIYGGSELYIDGRVDTVGTVTANGWKTEISEINEQISPIGTLDLDEDIHKNAQPYEYFEESPAYVEDRTVISSSIKVAGDVVISGTTFEGDCYIIADGNITYNVESFSSTGRVFLYSRNGNITINGSQININGAMYAPNGNIAFNTYDTTVNGFIWADTISYSGSIFNVTGANFDMVEPKSIVKTYTIDEDFNEGIYNGLALTVPNQLVLSEQSGGTASSAVKVFGDTETGKGVKITYSSDKSTVSSNVDTVNINYGLSGFGEADIDENAIDLIILIDESWSMEEDNRLSTAKEAAKEIVNQMKPSDRCAVIGFSWYIHDVQKFTSEKDVLISAIDSIRYDDGTDIAYGLNYAVDQFESSDRQKYIILLSDGEDSTNSTEIAKQAGDSGIRIFAMMIGSGTLQMQNIAINSNGIYKNAPTTEDIGKIMSYFAAEVFNVAGRNTTFKTTIKDANSVDISAITPEPSKITANDDGSVMVEWNIDRVTIDEQKEINIPVTVTSDIEGFVDILENTSCVYYDRNGKPNVVYADDVSLPISNHAVNGNWTVVFDSERETIDWENIYWNGKRYGDGTISVYISTSDDGENFTEPVKVENHKSFTGVSGRYAKISVDMTVSSDGSSPELYDITIVSKDGVLEQMTNNEPVHTINSKDRIKVNVPIRMRAVLTDDCLKSDISITWSCEDENIRFSDVSKLLTSVICTETGSYDIICTVSDGENTVQYIKTIVCEPADIYADIDPEHQNEAAAPKITVALPQYADRKEQISAKIENLNDTEISWYSVIFNNNTPVDVTDDGEFTLTMPNSDGTYKVVVRAFDWAGKSDVKEYSIIVDSTSAAVNIIPSSNEAIIGSEAYFRVSVAGSHKIKELTYTLNGELVTIPEDGTLVLDTTSEKEYILEAHGLTLTNKEIAASAKLTVIEADTEKPVVKISFDKNSYNEKQNAVVTVTAIDNVGVTSLVVLLNGKEVQLDSNGKYTISNLKYGDYIVTVNATDASGNIGTATEKITAKDVTKPELTLIVDKEEVNVGESVNIMVNASDNNGVVSTDLTIGTEKLAISDEGTAIFTPDTAGTYTVKAVATDPSGNKMIKQVTVTVEEIDTIAPVVTVSLDKDTYFELDDIIIKVSATDNVGVTDTVLFIDGTEVELDENGSYTIKNAELKSYEIIAKAYDEETNEGNVSETVVVNMAKAPEISVIFDKDIYIEGDSLVGFVKAEGCRDIASLTAKVNGQLFAIDDGRFELAELKEGIYKFEFSAEDVGGLSSKIEKSLTVLNKDNADIRLVALIDKQVKLGDNAELRIIASDEVDKSTISATLNGEKITLDNNLKYQFKGEKLFDNVFEITAKTLSGEFLSITLTVLVYETNKPKIGLVFTSHEDGFHYAHDDITGTLTVTDESGIKEVHVYYDGEELPIDENNHVYINDFVVANHTVIVKAVDVFGNVAVSGMVFYTVTVTEGTVSGSGSENLDSNELNALIYSPQDGGCVKGLDYIIGRADGTKFSHYKLEYASWDDKKLILLKEGNKPVNNQILGEFDTTMLRNGLYVLKLTVYDKEGNSESTLIYTTVEGNAKIGNFSIGFEDLTTNSLQTPLTLTRMYDSRDRHISGDFGYGWSQAVKNIRIYTNGPLGYGWNMEYDWRKGVTFNPTRSHIITVDWGNGKTDKFTMTAKPRNDAGMGYTAGIYFTPTNGSTSSLLAEETPGYYMCSQGYLVDDEEYTLFDPQNWTLTTADGTKYAINSTQGLQSITDKSGQMMTFTSGKIEGVNEALTITRDTENRITSVKTSSGSKVSYTYDENGDLASVTDISGNVTTFKYEDHYLTEIIDPRGVKVSKNIYDENGRLIKTIDADGNEIVYDHNLYGREEIITDRNGGVTRYIYDQNGNVLSQTDPMGNTVTNTYDSNGNLTAKTDAMGNITSYTYNNGSIATLTDAEGNVVKNTFDTNGRVLSINAMGTDMLSFTYDDETGEITSMTDALGNITSYDYDGKNLKSVSDNIGTYLKMTYNSDGEVISISNGIGTITDFTYDENGNCRSKTIKFTMDGQVRTYVEYYQYDEAGNLTRITDSDGNITSTIYNSIGKVTSATDQKGRQTKYDYDNLGNLIKITYADGTSESFTYDGEGNNLSATNRYGITVTMTYDKVGNLLSKTYPNGAKVEYAYNANYQLISETSTTGAVTKYEYDAIGRNTAIIDALGNRTEFEYNEHSQLALMRDAKSNEYKYEYDLNGNWTKTTYPDGSFVSSEYDARGRVTSQTDQHGNVTTYVYDAADRLISVTDALGNTTNYVYDEVGDLISITDANGNVTTYSYDDLSRLTKVTNALGKTSEITYDECGNVLTATDFGGKLTTYTYDAYDRLISKKTADGTTTYAYTTDGKLSSVTDKSGIIKYTYNDMVGLGKIEYANGSYVSYSYDNASRLTEVKTSLGSTIYEYDKLDRLVRVVDRNGYATLYEYDENGNRSAVRYANGIVVSYKYDEVNRLISEKALDKQGGLVAQYEYTLGAAGERTAVKELDRTVEYTYDALYRLTGEKITAADGTITEYTYAYDKVSNRILKTENGDKTVYTYNELNQLVKENDAVYKYDDAGNLISTTSEDKSATYTYNAENKLIRATVQEGNNVSVEEYEYDYAGNRTVKKSENNYTYYLNDVNGSLTQVLAELDANGNEKCWYTRGAELISQERNGAISYYLTDGHGSVRQLTDSTGTVTDTYVYDAWGNLISSTGDTENSYLYCGEQLDSTTGLYYLRARYMNPATGTFISMDTYQGTLFEPATLHKYLYANANPVMNVDPTGYFTLAELNVSQAINDTLEKWNDSWAIRTYHHLKSKLELINNCLVVYDTIRQATLWLTDPDASAMDVLFGIAGGIISGVFLKRMCDIKNIGPVISKIALLGGYASQVKAIENAITNEQWDQVITQTFHLTLSILALSDNCFTGETLVATEDGQKRIDEIEVGDKVWAYDIFTGETALKEVTKVYVHEVDEILHLYTSCGDIDTTTNHPFYVIERGWVAAGDLVEGDEIYLLDGTVAYVTGSELEQLSETIKVYNLEIQDFHTYFVGDTSILVHNRCKLGENMANAYGDPGPDYDAHHNYPQKFREQFESVGIDIDAAENGTWVQQNEHRSGAKSYNTIWEEQFEMWGGNFTKEMIENFFKSLTRKW